MAWICIITADPPTRIGATNLLHRLLSRSNPNLANNISNHTNEVTRTHSKVSRKRYTRSVWAEECQQEGSPFLQGNRLELLFSQLLTHKLIFSPFKARTIFLFYYWLFQCYQPFSKNLEGFRSGKYTYLYEKYKIFITKHFIFNVILISFVASKIDHRPPLRFSTYLDPGQIK